MMARNRQNPKPQTRNPTLAPAGSVTMLLAIVFTAYGLGAVAFAVEQILQPVAGGTLADGGAYGPWDGMADAADWTFNESSFEGAITLVREPPPALEQRVVFEFNLSAVTIPAPLTATLNVTVRGAPRFPAEVALLEVLAYRGDLIESLDDFAAPPLESIAFPAMAPFQPATEYTWDISDLVNALRAAEERAIGIRFQLVPQSPTDSFQVFMDILDSDPTTQPYLRLIDRVPGDGNGDRTVDLDDAALIIACITGPDTPRLPSCVTFDFDLDGDVDVADFGRFERAFARYAD